MWQKAYKIIKRWTLPVGLKSDLCIRTCNLDSFLQPPGGDTRGCKKTVTHIETALWPATIIYGFKNIKMVMVKMLNSRLRPELHKPMGDITGAASIFCTMTGKCGKL